MSTQPALQLPADPDVTLIVPAAPDGGVKANLSQTVEQSDKARAAIARSRDELIARGTAAQVAEAAKPAEEEAPAREDIESLVLELPDGKEVVLGPPAGQMTSYRVAAILGDNAQNVIMNAIVRGLLYIRLYDNKPPPTINKEIEAIAFMNQIGEDGVELITAACQMHWKPVTLKDLRVLKKNLR